MGKDKQESVCYENLKLRLGGAYVNKMLGRIASGSLLYEWNESPDFLIKSGDQYIGIEHFLIDQSYANNRSSSRVVDENIWAMYDKYHLELMENRLNYDSATQAVNDNLQLAFDLARNFNYQEFDQQFKRVMGNHISKIDQYYENMKSYSCKELLFLVEFRSLFAKGYSNIFNCRCKRKGDGSYIQIGGKQIVFTDSMIGLMESLIGQIKGIIFQNYSFFEVGHELMNMYYFDLSSREAFEKSIRKQRITVMDEYYISTPNVELKVQLNDTSGV